MHLLALAALLAAGLLAALLTSPAEDPDISIPPLGPVPAEARWISPSGSDSAPGTKDQPWRTLSKAVASVRPGDTVVLKPGTYGSVGTTTELAVEGTASEPITFRGEPDAPRPRILGAVRVVASHQRLARLLLDGPTGSVQEQTEENPRGEQVQLALNGEDTIRDIWVYDCEVRDSDWHAGIFLADSEAVKIVGNHIHGNGDEDDPGQANLSHGIYWDSGSGLVANNVVENNLARGIQLYVGPTNVVVTHNTIAGNGRAGVQLGSQAADNLVTNNIVVMNGDAGIRSAGLNKGGNVARFNLVWGNRRESEETGSEFVLSDIIDAPPGFREGGYELSRDSPAVDRAGAQGEVDVDREGRSRPQGSGSDLGAYESW